MRVLVVGGGGREHAVCRKLAQSPRLSALFCAPGNAGIAQIASCADMNPTDTAAMTRFALENHIDLCAVTSDDPLAAGMTDAMRAAGVRVFGPTRAAARIESSKIFAKELMKNAGIPTARCELFTAPGPACDYLAAQAPPFVVKASGLALGKGVTVTESLEEAQAAARAVLDSGRHEGVLIEEYMSGREVTVMCFTDGHTLAPMPPCRDHKRAFDGDTGPNTGGMGAISPPPDYTPAVAERAMREIFLPTLSAMREVGAPFAGVLYFELMLTPSGPKVIEYNARFGDPEAQTVLPLLKTDLLDIIDAVIDENLHNVPVNFISMAAASVVLASGGYPGAYQTGRVIAGLHNLSPSAFLCHSASAERGGALLTAGGRVLTVTCSAPALPEAVERVYSEVRKISFANMHYRNDIGKKDEQ